MSDAQAQMGDGADSAGDPTLAGARRGSALGLDPASYRPHPLHQPDTERVWPESNCYTDLWIEILNGVGVDSVPALAFTLATDFEGDQWTFFKFPLVDVLDLFGVDTQELSMWKAPATHALEQARRGRITLMEVDAHYLPDVAGTSYRREHTKTTIGIETIDLEARQLRYFHNAGYFQLEGDDFDGVFRVHNPWTPHNACLLPYTEFAKVDRVVRSSTSTLTERAMAQTRRWLARAPQENPFARWKPRFTADLTWLRGEPLEAFHLYAFATIRQFGSAFEMASVFVSWLDAQRRDGLADAATDLMAIATGAKALQFKLARAVNARRVFDPGPSLDELASSWERAMTLLRARLA